MKTNYLAPLLSVAILGIAALFFLFGTQPATHSLGADIPQLNGPMTISSSTATVTSSVVLATSTGRQYAQIGNDGANDVYLSVGQVAVKGKGIYLKAGTVYTVDDNNLFSGAIFAVATSGVSNLSVIEYK